MMLRKNRKKLIAAIIILVVICSILCINTSAAQALHWYCKRNADHMQPRVDVQFEIIERYQGVYVDKRHDDNCTEKVIYLTFDAGYENGNVARILDVLRDEQICGAFFILGNLINRDPELVKRMAQEGHTVCNHTFSHKNITKMNENELLDELAKLESAYYDLTGQNMKKYFRPPEGTFDESSLKILSSHGYKSVFWSFAYADWDNGKQMSASEAKKKILDNVHNGEIMLLHPTSETNAKILKDVIRELKLLGYRFGKLDEIEMQHI